MPAGERKTKAFTSTTVTISGKPTLPEEEYIPPGKVLLLSVFGQEKMNSGYAAADLDKEKDPGILLMTGNFYGFPRKAKNADVLLRTRKG